MNTNEKNIDSNIYEVDLEKSMKSSYLDYSMSVIVSRALPDVRDGLKPVHRRILYGMDNLSLTPDKPTRKSARVVGDVMGKYHPHGDNAIYEAVVRLAQDFSTRYPLVKGQGNFGSIDGDSAAAMRYTEIKMAKLAMEMLRDIEKNTVDFMPNFDESEIEPTVLPARFPNLLVNGSSGIAVGMSTNMAPHNLREVIDATVSYIDNNDITIEELTKHIKGPDFPTGAYIMGKSGIMDAYKTGRGKVKLRAVCEIVENKKNKEAIVITEIPYQVNKSSLIMKIADLVKEKKIEGISDIRDESGRSGMKIVIEIKRDYNAQVVLNNLYKHTQLETTFGIINLALVGGVPKVLNLKELISHYVNHQIDVLTRRTKFDLKKMTDRFHILKGLFIALDHIDEIINIIRTAYDNNQIKEIFKEKFDLTEIQTQAILDMQLKRLSGLEREKLEKEFKEVKDKIEYFESLLNSHELMMSVIKSELNEIKEKNSDKRRSKIIKEIKEVSEEELIEKEDILITLTKDGYIKRTSVDTYKVQNRGGKGIIGLSTKKDDFIKDIFITNTHDTLLFFTEKGRLYGIKGYEVPVGTRTSKGKAIVNLIDISKDENIAKVIPQGNLTEQSSIIIQTQKGLIIKTSPKIYKNLPKFGKRAIRLDSEDKIVSVVQIDSDDNLMIATKNGYISIIDSKKIRTIKSAGAYGVKAIKLKDDDCVVSMNQVLDNKFILSVSEYGFGKKTAIDSFTVRSRGTLGVKSYKVAEKSGYVVEAICVNETDDILMISLKGNIIRISVDDISTTKSRFTTGVKLKDVNKEEKDSDKIITVLKYIDDSEIEKEE